eukprot:SM006348S19854  [mRNA]  locus=s6348:203:831:+ [translate_table: standard]
MDSCICGPMYYFPSGTVGVLLGCRELAGDPLSTKGNCALSTAALTTQRTAAPLGETRVQTAQTEKANSGGSVDTMYACNCSAGFTQVGDATQSTATCVPGSAMVPALAPAPRALHS